MATDHPHLEQRVILIEVSAPVAKRAEMPYQLSGAALIDVAPSSITIR